MASNVTGQVAVQFITVRTMTSYLLLILLSLLVLHLILRYNKWARAINKIPGPPSLPLLGNMLQLTVSLGN